MATNAAPSLTSPSTPLVARGRSGPRDAQILKLACDALSAKAPIQTLYWDYYDGQHPMTYTAARLKAVFQNLDANFVENWCAVVINACNEKINLTGFKAKTDPLQKMLDTIWAEQLLNLESDDAHLAMLVAGKSFALLWRSDLDANPEQAVADSQPPEVSNLNDDEQPAATDPAPDELKALAKLQLYYNDARMVHLQYDGEDPRRKLWAAKWWVGDDGFRYLTLYFPEQLEYYKGKKAKDTEWKWSDFKLIEVEGLVNPAPNPLGIVPVYHFRVQKRTNKSNLNDALPLQNGINKLLADLMVSSEFGAFKQRWVISNSDTSDLKNAPGKILDLPAGDGVSQSTQVGEFDETDPSIYLKPMDALANGIAAVTETPKHFFFVIGEVPSGEALIALEAPLNKKARDRIDRATPVWQELMAAAVLVQFGVTVKPTDITPIWSDVRTVQPQTQAETFASLITAGFAPETVMRWGGLPPEEIEQALKERDTEQTRKDQLADQAAERAMQRFNDGQETAPGTKPPAGKQPAPKAPGQKADE